jgi:3-oxoacyl-[acyl-carrier protein] reductase
LNNKKIYIVTGGFSGIGLAICINLLNNNHKVISIGKTPNKALNLKKKFKKFKKNFDPIVCNLENENSIKDLKKYLSKNYVKIDGLVNNAGINPSRNNILKTSLSDWNKTLNVNLTGVFLITKYIISNLKNNSSIVNISSVAAKGMKNRISYSTSKAGLIGFTKSLAIDFAKRKIRVNCLLPGYVKTNLVKNYLGNLNINEKKELVEKHALNQIGEPQDISELVNFLLSEKSKWMTGSVINIDGGYLLNTQKLR